MFLRQSSVPWVADRPVSQKSFCASILLSELPKTIFVEEKTSQSDSSRVVSWRNRSTGFRDANFLGDRVIQKVPWTNHGKSQNWTEKIEFPSLLSFSVVFMRPTRCFYFISSSRARYDRMVIETSTGAFTSITSLPNPPNSPSSSSLSLTLTSPI
jgi:hypothetical protein